MAGYLFIVSLGHTKANTMSNLITWVNIPNFSNYEISTSGEIRNKRSLRILHTYLTHGYPTIKLSNKEGKKRFSIHRLVALMFIPNPDNKEEVNHKDGNKLNYNIDNLEWVTRTENLRHARTITKNGAVISMRKIRILYQEHSALLLKDFIILIELNSA